MGRRDARQKENIRAPKKEEYMNKILQVGTFLGAVSALASPAAYAESATITVTPTAKDNWINESVSGGAVAYVDGSPAGLGSSSLQLKTTTDNASKAVYAHPENMKLSDLKSASYWSKQVSASSAGGSASMVLGVDLNGDGTWDTNLVFEPYWQNNLSPDGAPVTAGEWQKWDVQGGALWSSRSFGEGEAALVAGSGGAPFYTLDNVLANYPDAKLTGIGVSVGSYNPDYTIDVDGVELNGVTYNFENTASNTGTVPTTKDDCKNDGWKTLSNVDGRMFKNQGQCVSFVASAKAHADVNASTDNGISLSTKAKTNIELQAKQ